MKLVQILEAPIVGDSYFDKVIMHDAVSGVIHWFREKVDHRKYDAIIGTGLSGSLIIPTLAREFKKNFAIIRKGESTHSRSVIEGYLDEGDRWIFVDDFQVSGATEERVKALVDQELNKGRHQLGLKYVGLAMYMDGRVYGSIEVKAAPPKIAAPKRNVRRVRAA